MKYLNFFAIILLGSCQIIINEEPTYYDNRDDLVGKYELDEYSESTELYFTYTIDIYKSCCHSNEIIIHNFYDVGLEITAQFDGHKLILPRQFVGDYEVEGTGRLVGSELTISYMVRNRYQRPSTDFLNFTAWRVGY